MKGCSLNAGDKMSSHSSLVIIQLLFKLSTPFIIFLYDLLLWRQSDVFDMPCVKLITALNPARGLCTQIIIRARKCIPFFFFVIFIIIFFYKETRNSKQALIVYNANNQILIIILPVHIVI